MSPRQEFSSGWRIIVASAIGIAVGIMALPFSTAGFFIPHLESEFGWSRSAISLASTLLILLVALASPFVGWLADQKSPIGLIGISLTAVAVGFFALSGLTGSISAYYAIFCAMALLGSAASSLIFARIVSGAFVQARGLALGLSMAGNAVTTMVAPVILVPLLSEYGWRLGYQLLGAVVLVAASSIVLLLRRQQAVSGPLRTNISGTQSDSSFHAAVTSPAFGVMAVAFMAVPLAATGLLLHFVPLLTDAGLSPKEAGTLAGLIGVGLLVGRIATGFLLDRFNPARVGAMMMVLSSAGFALLSYVGVQAAPFTAIAIGLAIGAEIDLIGFLTARYFGMAAYGRAYGILYTFCLVGTGLSPLLYGEVIDRTGTYFDAISAAAALLLLSSLLLLIVSVLPKPIDRFASQNGGKSLPQVN